MFCEYKDIFGKPNTGAHSYRVGNIAIVDVIFTIIGAYVLNYFLKIGLLKVTIILFILGIIMHKLFCVDTTINKLIFN